MSVSIKRWLKYQISNFRSQIKLYFVFLFFFSLDNERKHCPFCKLQLLNLPLHLEKVHKWSKTSTKSVIGYLQLKKKVEKSSNKNYHHPKFCPIEGCFKVTKNLGEHSPSKMYKLKPGPNYYQLLQSCKIHLPMTP